MKKIAWAKQIDKKAMEIAETFEVQNGRNPKNVAEDGVGYDIESTDGAKVRLIEVKGVSENWKTYTWQSLHHTEVDCLEKNPDKFYLYIIYFNIPPEERNEAKLNAAVPQIFIIPGTDLMDENKFRIKSANFALSPISKTSLRPYEIKK